MVLLIGGRINRLSSGVHVQFLNISCLLYLKLSLVNEAEMRLKKGKKKRAKQG